MKIGEKVFAVILEDGTIQSISASKVSIARAVGAAKSQGRHGVVTKVKLVKASEEVAKPVEQKKKIEWVIVDPSGKYPEVPCVTRAEARAVRNYDKLSGVATHIERREYVLVDSKKVS